jgi:hypothetical protein
MKPTVIICALFLLAVSLNAQEQEAETPPTSISKSLSIYVFPTNDQDQEQQDADEQACYKWATEQTGYDPASPPQIEADKVDTSPDGTAVRGAARGAAAGAAIGAIAGDAGKGAAIGAAAGGMAGARAKRAGDANQQQQSTKEAEAKEKAMLDEFKKAFSVCMEAKGYTAK